MKKVIIVLLVVATMAMATVRSGSSYSSDARLFDSYLAAVNVYAETGIIYKNGGYQYVAWFNNDYYSESDVYKVMSVCSAAALVSDQTRWSSDCAVCVFEDKLVGMSTQDCRTLMNMINEGYSDESVGYFFLSRAAIADIDDTNWSRP